MPGFLPPGVLTPLLKQIERSRFVVKNEVGKGIVLATTQLIPVNEPPIMTMLFMLNNPVLFNLIQQVVDCPKLGNFVGRMHRVTAGGEQHIDWHDDALDNRTVAINISLSTDEYTGGLFQLRGPDMCLRSEIRHASAGDAFLFRIGRGWSHRVTPVLSGQRTVGVGWFRTAPEWQDLLSAAFRTGILNLSAQDKHE
jgi:hypothetical protein